MKASILLLLSSSLLVLSANGTSTGRNNSFVWTANATYGAHPTCNLSGVHMPEAPTPLPAPKSTLDLLYVALGRGVQNYTCSNASFNSTPVSIGAIAQLYNASNLAACYSEVLPLLSGMALQLPFPGDEVWWLPTILSGFHYFTTNTTPVFNFGYSRGTEAHLGIVVGKKSANSTAPPMSVRGVDGRGEGAVAWLEIMATNATIGNVKSVYRLSTAGGNPPRTCLGMPPAFSVQYAAVYWFWGTG